MIFLMNQKNISIVLIASVVLLGLLAGILLTVCLAITPSLTLLDSNLYVLEKQEQIRVLQVVMLIVSALYLILTLIVLFYARKHKLHQVFWFCLWAFILVCIALAYSATTDIPYNQQILKWNAEKPSPDWVMIRDKWDIANKVRTIPTLLAFILQTIALSYFGLQSKHR
jgi:uncharacterized membrane protein